MCENMLFDLRVNDVKYPSEHRMAAAEKITTRGIIESPSFSFLERTKIKEIAEKHQGRKKGSANMLQYGHMRNRPLISDIVWTARPNTRVDFANSFLVRKKETRLIA